MRYVLDITGGVMKTCKVTTNDVTSHDCTLTSSAQMSHTSLPSAKFFQWTIQNGHLQKTKEQHFYCQAWSKVKAGVSAFSETLPNDPSLEKSQKQSQTSILYRGCRLATLQNKPRHPGLGGGAFLKLELRNLDSQQEYLQVMIFKTKRSRTIVQKSVSKFEKKMHKMFIFNGESHST